MLGARSERLARHEARARARGDNEGNPTKIQMYKYGSKEEYMDACRRKRNRARRDRRRRAHKRLMAATKTEETAKVLIRGGQKQWRAAKKRKHNKEVQRQKQKQRRQEERNRQIWARLQAIVATAKSSQTTLLQPATEEEESQHHPLGKTLIDTAMTGQHWVAIGEEVEDTARASVGRKVSDGILFRVAVSINGRRCVALVDSGASQSYIAPDTVTICELDCVPVVMHLELADGSKIESTEQTQDTVCTLGECIGKMSFTVTKLLSNVDVVLGMDWLRTWNPVIDWKRQILYTFIRGKWTQVHGVLLDEQQHCGTVKVIDSYYLSDERKQKEVKRSDWTVVQKPKLWQEMNDKSPMSKKQVKPVMVKSTNDEQDKHAIAVNSNESVNGNKSRNDVEKRRTLVSAKKMNQILKTGTDAYIAVFLPSTLQQTGQSTKDQIAANEGKGAGT